MASRLITSRAAGRALSRLLQTSRAHPQMNSTPEIARSFKPAMVSTQPLRWFSDPSKEPAKEENVETPPEAEETLTSQEAEGASETKEPTREELLEAQVKELKDQVLRSLADQENTRRIAKSDVSSARQFAINSFAKSLLDVADNLERAMRAVPDELVSDKTKNPELANLYEGIQLTEKGLLKAFQANGLQKFGKPGDAFDPHLHEALLNYPDPTQKSDHIGQVMKSGYKLNNRVLRPAEVAVVKNET